MTEGQLTAAKESLFKGNNEVLRFIRDHFPEDVYRYYIGKMKEVRKIETPEWKDLWEFYLAVDEILDPSWKSMDYYLLRQVRSETTPQSDRINIMDYFIAKVEEELKGISGL